MPNREVWMYDTFDGLTEPTEHDHKLSGTVEQTRERWETEKICYSPRQEVEANLKEWGVEAKLIEGDACITTKEVKPQSISVLRLDMDLYEPTKTALEELYPLLSKGGFLLIDDYNTWAGARKAVDEYFGSTDVGLVKRK